MNTLLRNKKVNSSFRDPGGFMFVAEGRLYRQVNQNYRENYDKLINSGLYAALQKSGMLISHDEISDFLSPDPEHKYKIIEPKLISFISYPYEWSFGQLKDAALLTLEIQKKALEFGMTLKDCSAYNIQFQDGKPVFIDTLSFEIYEKESPWVPYRQFCQHFLGPLALMALKDIRLGQMLKLFIDGIPLDLASNLLPRKSYLNFALLTHIHLHAKTQKVYQGKTDKKAAQHKISHIAMLGLIDSLESAVKKLNWRPQGTEWGDYYANTNYTESSFVEKKQQVARFLDLINPVNLWDLGANTGEFSRVASQKGISTVAFDIDPAAVEKNYRQIRHRQELNLLPLVLDLTNPSPSIGWDNKERESFRDRGPVDAVMALAIIHHLAISNNLPFEKIAEFLSELSKSLIIEFVPKNDSQVQRLLSTRKDIFLGYTQQNFEQIFAMYFDLVLKEPIQGSERVLYAMRSRFN